MAGIDVLLLLSGVMTLVAAVGRRLTTVPYPVLMVLAGLFIPGIRERIAGLGGTFPIGLSEGGVRISAIIPADRRTRREPEGRVLGRERVGRGMSPKRLVM